MTKLRMMDMTSAKLNMPLVIEESVETYDALGQPEMTWQHLMNAWGNFIHLRGQERWMAAQVQAEGAITLEMRYIPSFVEKLRGDVKLLRIIADGRTFDIDSYRDPDEKRKRLHLDVKEIL